MKFNIYSGAGNIFAFATKPAGVVVNKNFIQNICRDTKEEFSIDGVVFISKVSENEYSWDFYNSDGSSAEMCGNAARCAGLHVFEKLSSGINSFSLKTLAGTIQISKNDQQEICVEMPEVKSFGFIETPEPEGVHWLFLDTGVPHVVAYVGENSPIEKNKSLLSNIRHSSLLGPRGANVTLITKQKMGWVSAKTYERGVEDFTRACGTGAVAAAFWKKTSDDVGNQSMVSVEMPGGVLRVDFTGVRPKLSGPTSKLGVLSLEETKGV